MRTILPMTERSLPKRRCQQRVADDRDQSARTAARPIVLSGEGPADGGLDAERRVEVARGHQHFRRLELSVPVDVDRLEVPREEAGEDVRAATARLGEDRVRKARTPEVHEALGIAHRQGLEDQAVDEAEDAGGRADAERTSRG